MASRRWVFPVLLLSFLIAIPAILIALAITLTYPTLPSLDALTDYRPKVPLRIYSADNLLLGEFGEERRAVVSINEVPDIMKRAILAAEDDSFYRHGGIDYMGIARAALANFRGGAKQGASTITMQVARNFFLTPEKTFTRKFNEMLLAFKIEHQLTKDQILELYINQIYLGQRSYGFASAAQIYFGKSLNQINVAEAAMLAGLPKGPSTMNPVVNPKRARLRQQYVLRRMHDLKYIDDQQYEYALQHPVVVKRGMQGYGMKADYVAEMVRQSMLEKYGEEIYTQGFKVYTTIRQADQQAAYEAVRKGVMDYDRRHGYRGPEGFTDLNQGSNEEQLEDALQDLVDSDDLLPAVVLKASATRVRAYCRGGETVEISGDALRFAQAALGDKLALNQRIRPGSIVRLQKNDKGIWQISQLPQVEAAFVSGNPQTGAVYSLIGGFDFNRSQFNHITQAWRQPGSSIKPFIYSASLEKNFTPATIIEDAPLSFGSDVTGGEPWSPQNYDGTFDGPMRMRKALAKSKNLVTVRIMQSITPQYAQDYLTKFGFDAAKHPAYLTMALGAGSVTPMQLFSAYSVFANGGLRVNHYLIERIEDSTGKVLNKAAPGSGAQQVIDVRNAFTMVSMMQDVVKHGTAMRALQLGRGDLAGKTGTTNDAVDAWFAGFHPTLTAVAWIGFSQPRSLGKETGGSAALPMWINYMAKALKDVPEAEYSVPDGIVTVPIHHADGSSYNEYLYQENAGADQGSLQNDEAKSHEIVEDQLL